MVVVRLTVSEQLRSLAGRCVTYSILFLLGTLPLSKTDMYWRVFATALTTGFCYGVATVVTNYFDRWGWKRVASFQDWKNIWVEFFSTQDSHLREEKSMSDSSLSKLNTVLLFVVVVLLVWGLLRKPSPETQAQVGRGNSSGRFQPISASHDFVLDTATGKLCSPAPDDWRETWRKYDMQQERERQQRHADFVEDPKEVDLKDRIPSCSELK
jgi:hypothetical protein